MRFISLIPLFLTLVSHTHAAEPLQERVKETSQWCLEKRDWSKTSCKVKAPSDEYKRNLFLDAIPEKTVSPIFETTLGTVNKLTHRLYDLNRFVKDLLPNPLQCFGVAVQNQKFYDGHLALKTLIEEMRAVQKEQNLNDCQSACLAMCVSSRVIEYKDNWSVTADDHPEDIIQTGEGVCRAFSTLGRTFARAMGTEAYSVGSILGKHAFVKVVLKGKSYYMEPQLDECTLITSDLF